MASDLTSDDRDIIDYIEQVVLLKGEMPPVQEISLACLIPESTVSTILSKTVVRDTLNNRGLNYSPPGYKLTALQLATANAMLDFVDTDSEKKKLDRLGVTMKQYQTWRNDPVFMNYMTGRAEKLLNNTTDVAHLALIDSVRSGDVAAIKLHYEITQRYSSKNVGDMNLAVLLARILEVIQRHVRDPAIQQAIANDLIVIDERKEIAS